MARILQFSLFILVMMAITAGIHYYFWVRFARDTQLPGPWHRIVSLAIVILGISLPVIMFVSRALPPGLGKLVAYVPYVWMGMMFLMFTLALGFDLLKLIIWIAEKLSVPGARISDPSRRVFLSRLIAGISVGGAAGLAGMALYRAKASLTVEKIQVALDRLPRALDGFTIVQISDLHVGLTIGRRWVEQVVDRVSDLGADLIAVTGDLVDGTPEHLREQLAALSRLQAPYGVFFVTGNHEYYSGAVEWMSELEALGMRVLRNERVRIGDPQASFDLAGVDDFRAKGQAPGHGADLKGALLGRDPSRELVLLAHQPAAIHEAAEMDVGLQLSGHTHGGQIWPWRYLVGLNQPYVTGLHRHGARTQIYVNQGTGYWGPPMRLGTINEITQIRLVSVQATDRKDTAEHV